MSKIENIIFRAWEEKNPKLLESILAKDFKWHEDSYSPAFTDVSKLISQWQNDIKEHEDVQINSAEILKDENITVTHWRAKFSKNSKKVEVDGVFIITENKDGKLKEFKQWTQAR